MTDPVRSAQRHVMQATAVAIDGRGVVLIGPPGCGKSDLALRLIDRGALLIGDDAVLLSAAGGRVMAHAHNRGPGGLHVAGIGRVDVALAEEAVPVAIVIDLAPPPGDAARLGTPGCHVLLCAGDGMPELAVPMIALAAFEASTPTKVALALARWGH